MKWLADLIKDIAQGAVIVTILFIAAMIATMGILLIPYIIFVIFSFLFIRPFLIGKRGFASCIFSISKFFTISVAKFLLIAFAICIASMTMHWGYLWFKGEWDADLVASALFIGGLPMMVATYLAYISYQLAEQFFKGTWRDYTKALTGYY